MSQRNPQNARYTDKNRKGTTRKSAGSARPKSSAASTVYVKDKSAKAKEADKAAKERERQTRKAAEEQRVMSQGEKKARRYTMWRRIWLACTIIAIAAIAVYAIAVYLMVPGRALEGLSGIRSYLTIPSLIIGYAGIIAALAIDFIQIRPIRKAQTARARQESRKEQKHREAVEAQNRSKSRLLRFWNRDKDKGKG